MLQAPVNRGRLLATYDSRSTVASQIALTEPNNNNVVRHPPPLVQRQPDGNGRLIYPVRVR